MVFLIYKDRRTKSLIFKYRNEYSYENIIIVYKPKKIYFCIKRGTGKLLYKAFRFALKNAKARSDKSGTGFCRSMKKCNQKSNLINHLIMKIISLSVVFISSKGIAIPPSR